MVVRAGKGQKQSAWIFAMPSWSWLGSETGEREKKSDGHPWGGFESKAEPRHLLQVSPLALTRGRLNPAKPS